MGGRPLGSTRLGRGYNEGQSAVRPTAACARARARPSRVLATRAERHAAPAAPRRPRAHDIIHGLVLVMMLEFRSHRRRRRPHRHRQDWVSEPRLSYSTKPTRASARGVSVHLAAPIPARSALQYKRLSGSVLRCVAGACSILGSLAAARCAGPHRRGKSRHALHADDRSQSSRRRSTPQSRAAATACDCIVACSAAARCNKTFSCCSDASSEAPTDGGLGDGARRGGGFGGGS